MKEKKIVFCCRGGQKIGWGHIMRCLHLANWLKGKYKVYFIINQDPEVCTFIKKGKFPVFEIQEKGLPEKIEERLLNTILGLEPNIVVNDIQSTTTSYMQALRSKNLKIVNFDDTSNNAKYAHVLIDANRKSKEGKLFGPAYMVLSSVYAKKAKQKRVVRKRVRSIVISLGGSDCNNLSEKTIQSFVNKLPEGLQVNVVIGPSFVNPKRIEKCVEELPDGKCIYHCSDVSELLMEADIAITSGGNTMFESVSLGTPTLAISQNKPQAKNARRLERKGAVIHLGVGMKISAKKIIRKTLMLINSYAEREKLSKKAKQVVDGKGIFRAMEQVELL